ncbi:hypothetical protein D3C80_1979880 [compost metagenome]
MFFQLAVLRVDQKGIKPVQAIEQGRGTADDLIKWDKTTVATDDLLLQITQPGGINIKHDV